MASHSEQQLALSHCAYWLSLRTAPPPTDDAQTVTVYLPRHQQFSVDQLSSIMDGLSHNVMP